MVYLDAAATTFQKPSAVAKAVFQSFYTMTTPGRGSHQYTQRAEDVLFQCRSEAAELFGVSSEERVIITSSATHGLNIAIKSLVRSGDKVVVSGYEHNAVIRPLQAILGAEIKIAQGGLFDSQMMVHSFEKMVTPDVSAVICNYVSNVFGYILPIKEISRICFQRHVPLIIDASQAAGVLPVSMMDTHAKFIALPGHKGLYGPQGTGILLCADEAVPLMEGGTGSDSASAFMPDFLPDRLEPGTHNMPGISGLLEGIRFVKKVGLNRISMHEKNLIQYAVDGLQSMNNLNVYADKRGHIQTGVLSFSVSGISCEQVAEELAEHGIAVRAGLHCAPMAHRSAGTIEKGTVRLSVSVWNQKSDIDVFLHSMMKIIQKHK